MMNNDWKRFSEIARQMKEIAAQHQVTIFMHVQVRPHHHHHHNVAHAAPFIIDPRYLFK